MILLTKGYFQLARSASLNSQHRVRIGCVIALHGKPVSIGFNVIKTHPIYTRDSFRRSIHAEIRAVISARCDLTGGTAYVYREGKNGIPALAKPCTLCEEVLREVGIKTVFYSTSEYPYWERMKLWD